MENFLSTVLNKYAKIFLTLLDIINFMPYNCIQLIMVDSKRHIAAIQKISGQTVSVDVNTTVVHNIHSLDNLLLGIIILAIISIINLVIILG